MDRHIFLACPTYDGTRHDECVLSLLKATKSLNVSVKPHKSSDLAKGFNDLWCVALNHREELGITDFAMIHSDVGAPAYWLDFLVGERAESGADLLSCVVRKKDESGDTSTCYINRERTGSHHLTLEEVGKLPPTFGISDMAPVFKIPADGYLGTNTGLWICDFTQPWVEQVHFEMLNRIGRDEAGKFEAKTLPEDYNFAIQCANLGLKVMATSKIRPTHSGMKTWDTK